MKMYRKFAALLAGGAVFAVSAATVQAQMTERGLYLGASVGQSRFKVDTTGFAGSTDKTDTAWNLYGGYQFNRNFALEGGYVDLGRTTFTGTTTALIGGIPAGSPVTASVKSTLWHLGLVGSAPLTNTFALYGKLGLNYNRTRADATVNILGAGAGAGSVSDRNTDYTLGLGVNYNLSTQAAIRAGWDRYRVGDSNSGTRGDVDTWSVGLQFRF